MRAKISYLLVKNGVFKVDTFPAYFHSHVFHIYHLKTRPIQIRKFNGEAPSRFQKQFCTYKYTPTQKPTSIFKHAKTPITEKADKDTKWYTNTLAEGVFPFGAVVMTWHRKSHMCVCVCVKGLSRKWDFFENSRAREGKSIAEQCVRGRYT